MLWTHAIRDNAKYHIAQCCLLKKYRSYCHGILDNAIR